VAKLSMAQKLELYQSSQVICQHNKQVLVDWINKINK
jgi:hypothetical protein